MATTISTKSGLAALMARAWFHYRQWEDWAAGMYGLAMSETAIQRAVSLLGDPTLTEAAMRDVAATWQVSAMYRLSATDTNRRAWLGQAACCLKARATQQETCAAWKRLTDLQRARANRCADIIISEWEDTQHGQTLFAG